MNEWVKHESGLTVSSEGIIIGPRGNIRRLRKDRDGYFRLNCTINKKTVTLLVHRLVAECYIGPRRDRTVNHKNGIKTDNRVENLEYVSAGENTTHAFRNGLVGTCLPALGYYSKREAERQTGVSRYQL